MVEVFITLLSIMRILSFNSWIVEIGVVSNDAASAIPAIRSRRASEFVTVGIESTVLLISSELPDIEIFYSTFFLCPAFQSSNT